VKINARHAEGTDMCESVVCCASTRARRRKRVDRLDDRPSGSPRPQRSQDRCDAHVAGSRRLSVIDLSADAAASNGWVVHHVQRRGLQLSRAEGPLWLAESQFAPTDTEVLVRPYETLGPAMACQAERHVRLCHLGRRTEGCTSPAIATASSLFYQQDGCLFRFASRSRPSGRPGVPRRATPGAARLSDVRLHPGSQTAFERISPPAHWLTVDAGAGSASSATGTRPSRWTKGSRRARGRAGRELLESCSRAATGVGYSDRVLLSGGMDSVS
jgi:hypothetical protein